eukprot:3821673-Heterocapsa_arctica.AAC.1
MKHCRNRSTWKHPGALGRTRSTISASARSCARLADVSSCAPGHLLRPWRQMYHNQRSTARSFRGKSCEKGHQLDNKRSHAGEDNLVQSGSDAWPVEEGQS